MKSKVTNYAKGIWHWHRIWHWHCKLSVTCMNWSNFFAKFVASWKGMILLQDQNSIKEPKIKVAGLQNWSRKVKECTGWGGCTTYYFNVKGNPFTGYNWGELINVLIWPPLIAYIEHPRQVFFILVKLLLWFKLFSSFSLTSWRK